jgi:hypothetical protein
MNNLFRLTTLSVAATFFASLSHASVLTTYTFTGDCGDCTGQGTGTLVLQNYTLGDDLQNSNFVSFTYSSNLIDFTSDSLNTLHGSLSGVLPTDLPGPANVDIEQLIVTPDCTDCDEYDFRSETVDNNQWQVGVDDYGMNGVWTAQNATNTAAPEPASLMMLAAGLAGLLLCDRLRALPVGKRTT